MDAVKGTDAEVIIVNDGDKEIELPEKWNQVKVISNQKHSVASARNAGARAASGNILIFLDDDMLIHKQALHKMISLSDQYPGSTININWVYPPALLNELLNTKFGRYLHHYGFTTLKGWNTGEPWDEHNLFENIGITSQFIAIKKSVFEDTGGYDESFPHAGFEDYDFSKRLKTKGVRHMVWPKDTVYHNETDRHDLRSWLQRKERGGETRKHAVLRGNTELELHYTGIKKIILQFLSVTENFWIAVLNALPNLSIFDGVYGRLVNILLATSIFKGYTKIKTDA
jgi:GT2 family glycosyltransferase